MFVWKELFGLVSELFKPMAKLVDDLHTSDEEKMQLQNATRALELGAQQMMLEHQLKLVEAKLELEKEKAKIITAEINSKRWLASNWRPLIMVAFGVVIVLNFGLLPIAGALAKWIGGAANEVHPAEIPEQMWTLLIFGVTGYIGARSVDKAVTALGPVVAEAVAKRKAPPQ